MIDSMLYRLALPAGTYTAGVSYPLTLIDGPSVVRDGYGAAILKNIFTAADALAPGKGYVTVKNQNWVDSVSNLLCSANGNGIYTFLSQDGPCFQSGGDLELQPNSAFAVDWTPTETVTTTDDTDVFCRIDIDFPQVSAVANPANEKGAPVSILRQDAITINAFGASSVTWDTVSVDDFKAGYRYLLAQVGSVATTVSNTNLGFIKIHGAAGQNGLATIIPVCPRFTGTTRTHIDYSTPMVKGPMQISYMFFGSAAGTDTAVTEFDYIRR